ncbi:MAG: hypothetical protein U0838_16740 [Chloroflexota bacterium]
MDTGIAGIVAPGAVQVFGITCMCASSCGPSRRGIGYADGRGVEWPDPALDRLPAGGAGMATLAIFTFVAAWNDFLRGRWA